jgi:hypothetical protein
MTIHMVPSLFNILPCLPEAYRSHQEVMAGLSEGNLDRVDRAMTRHKEIALTHLKEQMQAEKERKEVVRRIKEDSPAPSGYRKRRKK